MGATEFRKAILALGMSQDQAAGWLRVTKSAVSRWANAERPIPDWVANLCELALEAKEDGSVSYERLMEAES